jgi:hypothetical protein
MIPRVKPEGMLFRKLVPTFRDHALGTRTAPLWCPPHASPPELFGSPCPFSNTDTRVAEVMEATFAKVRQYAKQRRCVGGGNFRSDIQEMPIMPG